MLVVSQPAFSATRFCCFSAQNPIPAGQFSCVYSQHTSPHTLGMTLLFIASLPSISFETGQFDVDYLQGSKPLSQIKSNRIRTVFRFQPSQIRFHLKNSVKCGQCKKILTTGLEPASNSLLD